MFRRKLRRPPDQANLSRYRNDPVGFVREVLGVEPWAMQIRIMEAIAREPRVTVRSCNGAGKTICAAWVTLWFVYTRPGSIAITTAPTGNQVRNLLWRRLRGAISEAKAPLPGRVMTQMLELGTNWYAQGFSTDEEVSFQGPHSPAGVLMVGDEASGLKEWVFAAMEGSMTEEGAKMLLIGNPNQPSGTFYDSHRDWPSSQKFHISAFDVPGHVLRPSWKEEKQRDWGQDSPMYQVRVLGEFPPQGDDSLIGLALAEAAKERDFEAERDAVEVGVDVARFGSDESVACIRRGRAVLGIDSWRGQDVVQSVGRIARLCRDYQASRVKVDDIGVGGGVTDGLTHTFTGSELEVIGVNVGEAAWDSEMFQRRRDEIWWGLRQRFMDGDISIPDDEILLSQLTTIRYGYTPRGQIKVESKDDLRKRRAQNQKWQSPDRADAMCLAFAECGNRFVPWSLVGETRSM